VLGQNRPGPSLENQPGGNYFAPILLHAERMFCKQEENADNKKKGGRKVYLVQRRWCPAGRTTSLAALWWRPVAVSLLTDGGSKQ